MIEVFNVTSTMEIPTNPPPAPMPRPALHKTSPWTRKPLSWDKGGKSRLFQTLAISLIATNAICDFFCDFNQRQNV